jgi:hypothetical protein
MEEKRINWVQIIVTAVITGVITIIAGMILFNLQTKKPKLTYQVPETSPFQGTGQNFAIYNVSLSNSGGTAINSVIGVIQVPNSSLSDMRISAPSSLKYTTSIVKDMLTLEIPNLNPSDTLSISILATSQSVMPQSPDVSVRGAGITGEPVVSLASNSVLNEAWILIVALVATLASGLSAFSSILGGRKSSSISFMGITVPILGGRQSVISGKHSEDQNMVIAYLCGLHGLLDDVENYLARKNNTSYWAEADRLSAIAMANPKSDEAENRKKVLLDLLEYASIASLSEAIIHYDIARVAFAQNKIEEAQVHLERAKKVGGKLIDTRLKIEPNLSKLIENNKEAVKKKAA